MSDTTQKGAFGAWVITASDRAARGERADASGPVVAERLRELGFHVLGREILPDGVDALCARFVALAAEGDCSLIVTTGGTGLSPRDLTPEATLAAADRHVPGLMELARSSCFPTTPFAALSRGVAVTIGQSLVLNLPGNPQAAVETLDALAAVLPHAVRILARTPDDCEITGSGS